MNDATQQPLSTTTVITQHPQSPRWIPLVTVILAILGFGGIIGGTLLAVGGWQSRVDERLVDHDKRLIKAEANQERYIPVLVSMVTDVRYLAERARRDDDAAARDRR